MFEKNRKALETLAKPLGFKVVAVKSEELEKNIDAEAERLGVDLDSFNSAEEAAAVLAEAKARIDVENPPAGPAAAASSQPSAPAASSQAQAQGTATTTKVEQYVVHGRIKVSNNEIVKKGTRLTADVGSKDPTYSLVQRKAPGSLKRITDQLFEVTEDVSINTPRFIEHGTILDAKKDAALIEELKHVKGVFVPKEVLVPK